MYGTIRRGVARKENGHHLTWRRGILWRRLDSGPASMPAPSGATGKLLESDCATRRVRIDFE